MIIDIHSHIYPDKIAEKAAIAIGKFYDQPMNSDGRAETLLTYGKKAGIDIHVISSVATVQRQTASINRFLSETAAAHPDRFIGFGTIHPDDPEKAAVLAGFQAAGLKGIKIHPDFQRAAVDSPGFCEVFEIASGLGLPVLCHTGDYRYDFSNPERVEHIIRMFPKLRFIAAHLGGWTIWKQAAEQLYKFDGLTVDCSSSLSSMSPEEATELIRLYGAERVLFGTDFPMWDPEEEIRRVRALRLTEEEKELILGRNAAALLGIKC